MLLCDQFWYRCHSMEIVAKYQGKTLTVTIILVNENWTFFFQLLFLEIKWMQCNAAQQKNKKCSYILGHCFQMKSISVSRIPKWMFYRTLWMEIKTKNCKETRIKCNVGTRHFEDIITTTITISFINAVVRNYYFLFS